MNDSVKDYRVTIKVRNARLLNALAEVGETVGQKLADKLGISYMSLLALSNLKASPIDKDGNIRPIVLKLCEFTNKTPLELFSVDQLIPLETNTAEVDMTADDVEQLLLPSDGNGNPEKLLLDVQGIHKLHELVDTLTPRETKVIQLRFGFDCPDHTYEEVGQIFGVSRERIRQIEAKALRKLRHPCRADQLRETVDYLEFPEEKEDA